MTQRPKPSGADSFPDSRLAAIFESYLERHRRGERPSIEEYAERYPDLVIEIRNLLPALFALERFQPLSSPIRPLGSESAPDVSAEEMVPARVGNYSIVREIGRGGMGIVFEAIQEPLHRRVAIKVLPFSPLLGKTLLERFLREAQAAARLEHPHIVPVYDFGHCEGLHYFAMQYISGRGLDQVAAELKRLIHGSQGTLAEDSSSSDPLSTSLALSLLAGQFQRSEPSGPASDSMDTTREASPNSEVTVVPQQSGQSVPPGEISKTWSGSRLEFCRGVAALGCQVADALTCAHEANILHRDLKPSNLLLDTGGNAWVADFGLAKDTGQESLSASGDIVGTLAYLAPERFQGDSSARSDIYSLGLTLYELLTLRAAFRHVDRGVLMRKIIEEEPPRPRTLEPRIPRDLEAIVLKAIQKVPGERYQNARELKMDLDRFLAGRPVLAPRAGPARAFWLFLKRRALVACLSACVLLLAAAYGIWSWVVSQQAIGPNDLVAADFDGDGSLDLAASNYLSGNVSIVLRKNRLSVQTSTWRTGSGPIGVSVDDLDGDQSADIVVTNSGSRTLSILLNNGRGKFWRHSDIPLAGAVFGAVTADLDGDGKVDIGTADGLDRIWLFKNQGDMNFGEPAPIESALQPFLLYATDVDGDGKLDMITSSHRSDSIGVLRNTGGGKFAPPFIIEAGGHAFKLALADLDADGAIDIAAVNYDMKGGSVAVSWNLKNGNFSPVAIYRLEGDVQAITAADLDGDGRLDLLVLGGDSHVAILPGKGDATFAAAKVFAFGTKPTAACALDWNGDGALDLIVTNYGSQDVSVIINKGQFRFEEYERLPLSPG